MGHCQKKRWLVQERVMWNGQLDKDQWRIHLPFGESMWRERMLKWSDSGGEIIRLYQRVDHFPCGYWSIIIVNQWWVSNDIGSGTIES